MGVELTKDSVDVGIVVKDAEASLKFYRDTLGLEYERAMAMPDGGTMYRLFCGTSMIKLLTFEKPPKADAPPGGIRGAYGYRYWTISVSNMPELLKECEEAGYKVVVPETEIRPGVSISIVEDPDANWVEFLSVV
jgi:catechol 2,3-dioxygenase-like lactoylglutathione lyase family enzyme